MTVLLECPVCHNKQSLKNNACRSCGTKLASLKKNQKVQYWIQYRLPDGTQKKEHIGPSLEEAKDADGKRRVQKREKRIFDIKPDSRMTFDELKAWFLSLESVKTKAYYQTLTYSLNRFNAQFGDTIVADIKPSELENLQAKRQAEGYALSTIDQELGAAKTMVQKAFKDGLVSGDVLRAFQGVKKLLKKNANARDRILTRDEFYSLLEHAAPHIKAALVIAFYTGMRLGEVLGLTWDKYDLAQNVIRLQAADTKDREPRVIPIAQEVGTILRNMPRGLHDNHVILYRGKPVRDIRTGLKLACEKAGILYGRFRQHGFIFHDLRHCFNTYMRKAGVPQSVIMAITGHSTQSMFQRYDSIDHEDRQQAVKTFERFIESSESSESSGYEY